MKIKTIKIKNVKGIENRDFELDLIPNKPNILVAPNGFGKSSFAVAFESMNSKRMILSPLNCHQDDDKNLPELIVKVENSDGSFEDLKVDSVSNSLAKRFDIFVINARVVPKALKIKIGGFTQATSSLEVKSIGLVKIPKKVEFGYHYSEQKNAFGLNGKLLPNIGASFESLMPRISEYDFAQFLGKKVSASITSSIQKINEQQGTTSQIIGWIGSNLISSLRAISPLQSLAQKLAKYEDANLQNEIDAFLAAIQIQFLYVSDSRKFKQAMEYAGYQTLKSRFKRLCEDLYQGWAAVEIIEDKKSGWLVVNFPKANQFSNGQRDILSFVFMLEKARIELKGDHCILVIDEVFDYLDDANLIAFQYFITQFIEQFKADGRKLFPILLTHLDPEIFNHFCFGGHRIKVHYLDARPSGKSEDSAKLIIARGTGGASVKSIEQHFFHFHPLPQNHSGQLVPHGIPQHWEDPKEFHRYVDEELNRYLSGKNYDPLAICFSVRIRIEEAVYLKLNDRAHMMEFIATNGTTNKLDYATSVGIEVPESFYLLGLIYNDGLHLKGGRNPSGIVGIKLRHPIIRGLISRIKI